MRIAGTQPLPAAHFRHDSVLSEVAEGARTFACSVSGAAIQDEGGGRPNLPSALLAAFALLRRRIEAVALAKSRARPEGTEGIVHVCSGDLEDDPEPEPGDSLAATCRLMRVVRMRPDRSVEVLGECHDFDPPEQPGDTIVVMPAPHRPMDDRGRTLPYVISDAAAPRMRFPVRGLLREGASETAVEAAEDGPHPSFLPGWRPFLP